ncbi:hypothetical protein SAMN04487969_11257 [Paenibacillus algorifonticola]|uniref:Uncharacterized protein n=1 Tax=Paenibacillus algorifonticola TaxID=684063 RepID=A0A1I2FIF5_9BACL|nr:hypothetical protein [Paenibacillus algorifonticola]SFF04400.1 hypothetical protein SAMN04487969_11257 [Paenibacillus algorifonticola]
MAEKMIVVISSYLLMTFYNLATIKKMVLRDKIAYGVTVFVTIYLCIEYIGGFGMPFLHDLASWLFKDFAHRIIEYLD